MRIFLIVAAAVVIASCSPSAEKAAEPVATTASAPTAEPAPADPAASPAAAAPAPAEATKEYSPPQDTH